MNYLVISEKRLNCDTFDNNAIIDRTPFKLMMVLDYVILIHESEQTFKYLKNRRTEAIHKTYAICSLDAHIKLISLYSKPGRLTLWEIIEKWFLEDMHEM